MALTDHDTVDGLADASARARDLDLGFLPGVEISAALGLSEVHVVGLGVRLDARPLLDALRRLQKNRLERSRTIIDRLRRLDVVVDFDAVQRRAGGGAVGRLHIAQELEAQGYVATVQDAFTKYLGRGRSGFVFKKSVPCAEAVELIHSAEGLAFIAHPGLLDKRSTLKRLLGIGFDGIEAYHVSHSPGQVEAYASLAREHGLLIAGGSDCHGAVKDGPEMGKIRVPYAYYEAIVNALAHQNKAF